MRFIMTVGPGSPQAKLTPQEPFDAASFEAMMKFNEDMHRAGILVASEGLNPAGTSVHVRISKGKRQIVDGPFAETKELVGGFYVIQVKSLAEAMEWAARYPGGFWDDEILEVRPLTGEGDLPAEIVALIRKAAPTWSAAFHT